MKNLRTLATAIAVATLTSAGSALAAERPTGASHLQRLVIHGSPVHLEPSVGQMSKGVARDRLRRKGYKSDTLVRNGRVWEMKDVKTGKLVRIDAFSGAIDDGSGNMKRP
jgi:hypothetical protein